MRIVLVVASVRLVGEDLASGDPLLELHYFHCSSSDPRKATFDREVQRLFAKMSVAEGSMYQYIAATIEEQQVWLTTLARNTLALDSKYYWACKKKAPVSTSL